jgi:hypothetical protein
MKKLCVAVSMFAGVCATFAARADNSTAVTYEFTGTIITALAANDFAGPPTGLFAGDTGTVSGTFTFDFANANPALSTSVSTTGFHVENWSGTGPGSPQPQTAPGNVFSTTLVGTSAGDVGLSYSTSSPGTYESSSYVDARSGTNYSGSQLYLAAEANRPDSENGTQSAFFITAPLSDLDPPVSFSSSGLPVFVPDLTYSGSVSTVVNGTPSALYFDVTSLAVAPMRAPEIDPVSAGSALTLLAGFAAIIRGRRRVAA